MLFRLTEEGEDDETKYTFHVYRQTEEQEPLTEESPFPDYDDERWILLVNSKFPQAHDFPEPRDSYQVSDLLPET